MRTNLNPFMYKKRLPLDWLKTIPGTYTLNLQPGQYQFALCGGGGAGGMNGGSSHGAGGSGGGGGNGDYVSKTQILPYGASLIVTVPTGGLTYANGGNGGNGGSSAVNGGAGGGGGAPAIVKISTTSQAINWGNGLYTYDTDEYDDRVYDKNGDVLTDWSVEWRPDPGSEFGEHPTFFRLSDSYVYTPTGYSFATLPYVQYLFANGGAGGGGGGGGGYIGRYANGGGGGGGGGYYYFNNETAQTISVPGKTGANGQGAYNPGASGVAGNPQFSELVSGGGTIGVRGGGSSGASGGGASGGSGGSGENDFESWSGGGGGGAPGAPTAHGGQGGVSGKAGYRGGNGSNYDQAGSPSINPDGESLSGGFGAGGNANENGFPGWVRIIEIPKPKSIQDLGLVTESVSTIRDNGLVTETVETIQDMGGIK